MNVKLILQSYNYYLIFLSIITIWLETFSQFFSSIVHLSILNFLFLSLPLLLDPLSNWLRLPFSLFLIVWMKSNVSHQIFAQTKSHCHVSEIKIPELKVTYNLHLGDTFSALLLLWDFSLYEVFMLKDITSVFYSNFNNVENFRKIDLSH